MSVAAAPRRLLFALATNAAWEKWIRALPGGERSAYRLAGRYFAGTRLEDALACAHLLAAEEGLASSIDFFGESVPIPSTPTELPTAMSSSRAPSIRP